MAKGVKVALPGYNAITDTDPSHFSLYVDGTEDHVLVKEKERGTQSVSATSTASVAHGVAYYPSTLVMAEVSSGEFQWSHDSFGGLYNPFYHHVTTTNLVLGNQDSSSRSFFYIIFYDEL